MALKNYFWRKEKVGKHWEWQYPNNIDRWNLKLKKKEEKPFFGADEN